MLAVTRQNVREATLTSPISGTVAALGLTAGAHVGASSSSASVTIVGTGQFEVSTAVALSSIDLVKVGQSAQVTVDGVGTPIPGTVTGIGFLSSTTGSSTTYPVTILLGATSAHLIDGAGASVSIAINTVDNVLTVPSSAVHLLGTVASVTVLSAGKPVITRVQLGAVASDRTQIRSGLTAGQQVVLATLGTPLPTATSNAGITRRLGVTSGGGALTGGLGGTGPGRPGG
jgi:hypothetical protein